MNPAEIDYWCGRVLNARNKKDWENAVNALKRELAVPEKPDPGWLDGDRPMPGFKKIKFVGPLELLGIPIKSDESVQPGKIEFRDTFDFDFDPGNAA